MAGCLSAAPERAVAIAAAANLEDAGDELPLERCTAVLLLQLAVPDTLASIELLPPAAAGMAPTS
jgi:hypothetical protein